MEEEIVISDISIEVTKYRESQSDPGTILFSIAIHTRSARWVLEKQYSEFRELKNRLDKYFWDIPDFPEWKLTLKLTTEQLEERRAGLADFMQRLSIRKDMFNSPFVREFLLLDNYCKELLFIQPILHAQFKLDDQRGFRACIYIPHAEVFVVGTGDFNPLSRFGAYITNMKLPWEDDLPTIVPVGSAECWAFMSHQKIYKQVWSKIYPAQVLCMNLSEDHLFVGLQNGTVDWLRVSTQHRYRRIREVQELTLHTEKVHGIFVDSSKKAIFTISEDRLLIVYDYANKYKVNETQHDEPLTAMQADSSSQRLFVGNFSGQILIYSIEGLQPRRLKRLCLMNSSQISHLQLDRKRNYLFCSELESGNITIFNLEKPGKQKFAKKVASFNGKQKVNCMAWSSQRMQLFLGHKDGTVTIWNAVKSEPICLISSEESEVTQLYYDEDTQILMVYGRKAVIRSFKLPRVWRDPKIEDSLVRENQIARKTYNILKVKQAIKQKEIDSDEDDLKGWSKTPHKKLKNNFT